MSKIETLARNISVIRNASNKLDLSAIDAKDALAIKEKIEYVTELFQVYIDFENGFNPDKEYDETEEKEKRKKHLPLEESCRKMEKSFLFLEKSFLCPISKMDSETQDWARSLVEDAIELLQKYLKS